MRVGFEKSKELVLILAKLREIVVVTYQPNYLSVVKQLKEKFVANVRCREIAR